MVEQYLVTSWISWLLLALQVKVGKVASFVGKIRGFNSNHVTAFYWDLHLVLAIHLYIHTYFLFICTIKEMAIS